MANTSSRMLRLLSLLQTHRYWPGTELADRLGVSPRTLRRDIERLRDLGYPVDANRGVDGGYQLQAGTQLPPLLLDDEEAVAIAVGLRTAAGGAIAGIEETSVRALAKIVQVMPARLRRRVDALQAYTVPILTPGPTVDAETLSTIAQACRDEERIAFGYTTRDGREAARTVEPHRLVSIGRRWYLLGWDLDRHDWRSFRLDRLSGPARTGVRFRGRDVPGGDAAAYVQRSIESVPTRHDVVVEIATPAADVSRLVSRWGEVEPVTAGSCRLRMSVDSLAWPAMVLGAVGASFTVVSPPELLAYLRSAGERFLAATG